MHQIQRYFRKAGKAILRFFTRVAHGSVLDIAILVCAVGLVGVGTTIAVVSSQKPQSAPVDVSSTVPMSVSSSVSTAPVEEDIYDPDENALDLAEFDGTLLTETTDGGEAYLKDTIFIGDSNTYRLATYSLTSWQNNLSAVGMGIQHVTSTPSMYFKGMSNPVYMARAVAMMQPRRIVITYGTNNTDSSVEAFKSQYRTALEAIKKEWPYADIIINAIPPVAVFRSNAANTQKTIDAFNKALAELAKEDGYQFLNSSEVLKDPKTGYARIDYMIGDGLHLNEDGAKALMGYVRTHTHIVADTRPALKDIPIHEPTPESLFNPQAASSSSSSSSEVEGVTVKFFITSGQESYGELSGTLTQVVEPGKACAPVTVKANTGCIIAGWGCTDGALYPGRGLSAVTNNQQTATYTVPSGTTYKELSVWVSFAKEEHTHTYSDWAKVDDNTHERHCTDNNCPDSYKETGAHNWPSDDTTSDTIKCKNCPATKENLNKPKPVECQHQDLSNPVNNNDGTHSQTCQNSECGKVFSTPHSFGSYVNSGEGGHTGTCSCGATETIGHDQSGENGLCAVCGYGGAT